MNLLLNFIGFEETSGFYIFPGIEDIASVTNGHSVNNLNGKLV